MEKAQKITDCLLRFIKVGILAAGIYAACQVHKQHDTIKIKNLFNLPHVHFMQNVAENF